VLQGELLLTMDTGISSMPLPILLNITNDSYTEWRLLPLPANGALTLHNTSRSNQNLSNRTFLKTSVMVLRPPTMEFYRLTTRSEKYFTHFCNLRYEKLARLRTTDLAYYILYLSNRLHYQI